MNSYKLALESIVNKYNLEFQDNLKKDINKLIRCGGESFEAVLAIAEDEKVKTEIRTIACWLLGELGDIRASKALLKIFETSNNNELIWETAKSIIALNIKQAIPMLKKTLFDDPSDEKRAASAYMLGRLSDSGSGNDLLEVVLNKKEIQKIRGYAAESLGVLREKNAVNSLLIALYESNDELRFWIIYALGQIGDPAAIPDLEGIAKGEDIIIPGWGSIKEEVKLAIDNIKENRGEE